MKAAEFGWPGTEKEIPTESLARITSVHRSVCHAISTDGELNIYLSGRFHHEVSSGADKPATGDFIKIGPSFVDEQNSNAAVLEDILPRHSKISRMAAGHNTEQVLVANVDFAFIVTSANDDFNVNRLQRYVLLATEGHVTPVIVLSKVDLDVAYEARVLEIEERLGDIEILPVSSLSDVGLDKVKEKLKVGTTSVFLGSSGVGKSTIVNKLLGEEVQFTKEIREDDAKGRHATTARELFFVPDGGMIIDTAGLREVQVLAGEEAVATTFKDISELMQQCRFSDCTHEAEQPGCAIQSAFADGSLSEDEYANYLKLQREAAFAESKLDKAKSSNSKERWKTIHQNYKAKKKFEGRD